VISDANLATQSEKFGHPFYIEKDFAETQKKTNKRADEVHLVMYYLRKTDTT
jgi:hypothetical protein